MALGIAESGMSAKGEAWIRLTPDYLAEQVWGKG